MENQNLEQRVSTLEKRVAILEEQDQVQTTVIKGFVNNRTPDVRELVEELELYRSEAAHKTELVKEVKHE